MSRNLADPLRRLPQGIPQGVRPPRHHPGRVRRVVLQFPHTGRDRGVRRGGTRSGGGGGGQVRLGSKVPDPPDAAEERRGVRVRFDRHGGVEVSIGRFEGDACGGHHRFRSGGSFQDVLRGRRQDRVGRPGQAPARAHRIRDRNGGRRQEVQDPIGRHGATRGPSGRGGPAHGNEPQRPDQGGQGQHHVRRGSRDRLRPRVRRRQVLRPASQSHHQLQILVRSNARHQGQHGHLPPVRARPPRIHLHQGQGKARHLRRRPRLGREGLRRRRPSQRTQPGPAHSDVRGRRGGNPGRSVPVSRLRLPLRPEYGGFELREQLSGAGKSGDGGEVAPLQGDGGGDEAVLRPFGNSARDENLGSGAGAGRY
mmetsp:Transcript_1821/g.3997  ORF Transcript_1821/g.3997 Transcript_1821/m.3997 type:complete len:366 (+) Transcript_1821:980-2077(+)